MRFDTNQFWERCAWGAWLILALVTAVRPALQPGSNTVFPIYTAAATNWVAGEPMYGLDRGLPDKDQFRYAPIFALTFVPMQWLPDGIAEMSWRLLGAVCLLSGLAAFVRHFSPELWATSARRAALLGLLLPLSIGSMNNGQVNVHMTGLLLFAATAAAQQRWNVAALCLAASVFCKLYPLAVVLLLVAMYPRALGWRMVIALSVGFVVPFLAQTPSYVAGEYGNWLASLRGDDRRNFALGHGYRDLDLLLRWCGLAIPRAEFVIVQFLGGMALALFAWKRPATTGHLRAVYDLAACWMILLGPATESCTYILLAPTLACAVAETSGRGWLLGVAWSLTTLTVVGTGFGLPKVVMGLMQVVGALALTCDRLRTAFFHETGRTWPFARGWEAHGR